MSDPENYDYEAEEKKEAELALDPNRIDRHDLLCSKNEESDDDDGEEHCDFDWVDKPEWPGAQQVLACVTCGSETFIVVRRKPTSV